MKTEVHAKRAVGGGAPKPPKAKVQAKRLVAKKAPKREDSKDRESERRIAEGLEREKAIGEILRVMSVSPGDIQPVLEAVAERAAHLCGAPYANVLIRDGETLRPSAFSRLPERTSVLPIPLTRGSVNGRAVLDRTTIHHADIVPFLNTEFPDARQNAQRLGVRAQLAVPLLRKGEACGTIVVFRREPRPFSPEQIALVETFAQQAVIAIDNARLFNETREALEQQTATSDILGVISRSPTDVQPVFDTIAAAALKLCRASSANVLTFDGEAMHLAAVAGVNPNAVDAVRNRFPRPASRDTAAGRAIQTRSVAAIPDVLNDPEFLPTGRSGSVAAGFRSVLGVPLMRGDKPIGVIAIGRPEPGPFTDKQVALVKIFADQAVIAIENVRLFRELTHKNHALTQAHAQVSEALERQTATGEVLRIISGSPTDVRPVFETIVASAARLCSAESAAVYRFDREVAHFVAGHHLSPEAFEAYRRRFPRPLAETDHLQRVVGGSVLNIPEVEKDPHTTREGSDHFRARGVRSIVIVPMVREGQAIGAIGVFHRDIGAFSDDRVELLKTFADQALIAIENVRLFTALEARTTELTRSVEELKALSEVGQAVSSTLDLETVLSTIVSRAAQLAGMDGGSIWEYDETREEFHLHATDRLPAKLVEALRAAPIRKGEGALGRLAMTLEPVQIRDIADEHNYQSRLRQINIRSGFRSVLAVPLLREDHLLGALAVNRASTGEFAPEKIDLLKTFATQSALALQNARLFREIEHKSRQLEVASRHKSEFLANMSHELRTPLNAIIGFSEVLHERMFGEINEKQAEYIGDILASGQHLLSLINDILDLSKIEAGRMELELSDFDLPSAIENTLTLVRERAVRRGITLGRKVDERLGMIRADERKVKQVLLNLLSNALKFTPEGGKIEVRAAVNDDVTEVSVHDTGVGIAPEDHEAVFEEFRQVGTAYKKVEGTGLGLAISRKFIELHGGRIWVTSNVGSGSAFTFALPLHPLTG